MRILGIDPGYDRLGVAIIEKDSDTERLLYSECVKTQKKDTFIDRLKDVGETVSDLISIYEPNVLAIEKLYFTNNQKTAMNVSQVIGAIIYIAKSRNMNVHEYTPLQIKSACTGNGKANKNQMMSMIPNLIQITKKIKYDDEYDAIAVCITHSAYNS